MDQCCSQSTPFNYYTPKVRSPTLQKCPSKCSVSTVTKHNDLEESFKLYEQLLAQNIQLKNMLFNQSHQNTKPKIPHFINQPLTKTKYFNQSSDIKLTRQQSSKCLNSTMCNQSSYREWSHPSQTHQQKQNDIAMWSIKQRNKYLQQKLQNIQNQYQKQHTTITSIMGSDKWKNRFDCTKATCYQDKYLKVLRVKSPVLLD